MEPIKQTTTSNSTTPGYVEYNGDKMPVVTVDSSSANNGNSFCFAEVTHVYSKFIGYNLPYGSAGRMDVRADRVSFASSLDSKLPPRKVTIHDDGRITDEIRCDVNTLSCKSEIKQSEMPLASAKIFISLLNDKDKDQLDVNDASVQVLLDQIQVAQKSDRENCRMTVNNCP